VPARSNGIVLDKAVTEGLDYILDLVDHQIAIWPRTVSTHYTQGKQIVVYTRDEAIARFRHANYIDCRISAYPYHKKDAKIPCDFIMIDLDRGNFGYDDCALESALRQTLAKIRQVLIHKPTVVWSGNGYHIYIPITEPILENIKELSCAGIYDISAEFIRFAERYLSRGRSDPAHNKTVSLQNCMLRIPGSINSNLKLGIINIRAADKLTVQHQVKLVKRSDPTQRPHIKLLIGSFYAYIVGQQMKLEQSQYNVINNGNTIAAATATSIPWIDKLLQVPLPDRRKYCMWKILAPYLINTRKLSYDQSFAIMANWLSECNKLRRLDFNASLKIKDNLNGAIKNRYFPTGLYKLNCSDPQFYNFLQKHEVI
jgi:hypothetical protein